MIFDKIASFFVVIMENSKTLEILLKNERHKIQNYFADNSKEILDGIEKIFKICCPTENSEIKPKNDEIEQKLSAPTQKSQTSARRFPTSINFGTIEEGRFPSFRLSKIDSQSSSNSSFADEKSQDSE